MSAAEPGLGLDGSPPGPVNADALAGARLFTVYIPANSRTSFMRRIRLERRRLPETSCLNFPPPPPHLTGSRFCHCTWRRACPLPKTSGGEATGSLIPRHPAPSKKGCCVPGLTHPHCRLKLPSKLLGSQRGQKTSGPLLWKLQSWEGR